jgi:putative transcriptional regulator
MVTTTQANAKVTSKPEAKGVRRSKSRVADEIMSGMRELEQMMNAGQRADELFTVKTLEIPTPHPYTPRQLRALRASLRVSQAAFAQLLGVSTVLVKSWEQGTREPSLLARRLLDTIRSDPARWLASVAVNETT